MFIPNSALTRVLADDRRRDLLEAAHRRHVRHEAKRLRRLRVDT